MKTKIIFLSTLFLFVISAFGGANDYNDYAKVRKVLLNKYHEGMFQVQITQRDKSEPTLNVHRAHFKDSYQYMQVYNLLMQALQNGNTIKVRFDKTDKNLDDAALYKPGEYDYLFNN